MCSKEESRFNPAVSEVQTQKADLGGQHSWRTRWSNPESAVEWARELVGSFSPAMSRLSIDHQERLGGCWEILYVREVSLRKEKHRSTRVAIEIWFLFSSSTLDHLENEIDDLHEYVDPEHLNLVCRSGSHPSSCGTHMHRSQARADLNRMGRLVSTFGLVSYLCSSPR